MTLVNVIVSVPIIQKSSTRAVKALVVSYGGCGREY